MKKHVENVLTPKLSQMQGMYNEAIEEKLATIAHCISVDPPFELDDFGNQNL